MKLEAYDVVWFSFSGDPHPKGFPYCPDDHGLVLKFLKWCTDEKIHSPIRTGMSGGGQYVGAFFRGDAKRVLEWWKEHGVEEERYDAWAEQATSD